MKAIIADEMEAGALGLSTGLKYRPGVYAKNRRSGSNSRKSPRDTVVFTPRISVTRGSVFYEAVEEAIDIGRRAGIPVQLSHHKGGRRADTWGRDGTNAQNDRRRPRFGSRCHRGSVCVSSHVYRG